MKYRIISVGKINERFFAEGINEYLKRLAPYASIQLVEGLEERVRPRAGEREIAKFLDKEGDKVLKFLGKNDLLIVFDGRGKSLSSEGLAEYMANWNVSGCNCVNLVIGSSHGLANKVKEKADNIISLSRMTFPHQMAVLILAEQVYRAFKILRGEPYHR
ncbi:MAG: 23S rRNA (pseudouridine(1915)-N(3))-methyltransferase RlmH [Syntrophomonadaceae bacterium]|nr:23S rRNA (pseudouridine(1915)-N(3))-methyltransferase RlmH [Syntrophomonadaceae bacterium]